MTGYVGLFAYIGFFLLIFIKAIRSYNKTASTPSGVYFEAALIGFIALHLFHAVNFSIVTTNVLLYFLGVYILTLRMEQSEN